jgi:hypothetical protein
MNYFKPFEMNSFFTLHIFLEVGKTQDLSNKIWQNLEDSSTTYALGSANSTLHRAARMELIPDARFYWDPCNFVPSARISVPAHFFPTVFRS